MVQERLSNVDVEVLLPKSHVEAHRCIHCPVHLPEVEVVLAVAEVVRLKRAAWQQGARCPKTSVGTTCSPS